MPKYQQFFYKEDGDFVTGEYIPYDDYIAALKRLVRYTDDMVLVDQDNNFLLPKRKTGKSASGPWFFGGQVPAFTSPTDSLMTTLKREAGLTIAADRFVHLARIRMWFNGQEGFAHDALSEVFFVKVTAEEIQSVRVDTEEYEDEPLQVYTLKDFQDLKDDLSKKVLIDMWNLFQQTVVDLN